MSYILKFMTYPEISENETDFTCFTLICTFSLKSILVPSQLPIHRLWSFFTSFHRLSSTSDNPSNRDCNIVNSLDILSKNQFFYCLPKVQKNIQKDQTCSECVAYKSFAWIYVQFIYTLFSMISVGNNCLNFSKIQASWLIQLITFAYAVVLMNHCLRYFSWTLAPDLQEQPFSSICSLANTVWSTGSQFTTSWKK